MTNKFEILEILVLYYASSTKILVGLSLLLQ
jgi:hypothetical protein